MESLYLCFHLDVIFRYYPYLKILSNTIQCMSIITNQYVMLISFEVNCVIGICLCLSGLETLVPQYKQEPYSKCSGMSII